MTETEVSASHFRVHFKEIANAVATGEQVCTVARHGLRMVVVVSLADAAYLREHKWKAGTQKQKHQQEQEQEEQEQQQEAQADTIALVDPFEMPIDLLEEAYGLTEGTTDFEIGAWRFKAYFAIKSRTGKDLARPFGPSG